MPVDDLSREDSREGHLAELFREAGLREVEDTTLAAQVEYASFEDWWEPYTAGVGPAGAYVCGLDDDARDALQERCRQLLPDAPFKTINRGFKLGDAKIGTKLDGRRQQHLIHPQLHGEKITHCFHGRF